MTDDKRIQVLQRSRELLARSQSAPAQPPPARAERRSIAQQVSGAMFDPVKREGWPRSEPLKEPRGLDTMPIDWQDRIDATIQTERATTYEVIAQAIAETTAEYERQLAELKSEVESLKADYTAVGLQKFADKLDRTVAQCTALIDRLDRGPIDLPSLLSARRSSSVN